MLRRTRLLVCAVAGCLVSCDHPVEVDIHPSTARLVGATIKSRHLETFNLDAVIQRKTTNAAVTVPLLSVSVDANGTSITCKRFGNGTLTAIFPDNTTAEYGVVCREIVAIELAIGRPFEIDRILRGSEGRDVQAVVQSDGLVQSRTENGYVIIMCAKEGKGTLWVYFDSWTDEYYDELLDYYDLTCIRENFPIEPAAGKVVNVSAYFRHLDGRSVTRVEISPSDVAVPVTVALALSQDFVGKSLFLDGAGGMDVGLLCQKAGQGTLKVYFEPNTISNMDEYLLTCRGHDQGGGG